MFERQTRKKQQNALSAQNYFFGEASGTLTRDAENTVPHSKAGDSFSCLLHQARDFGPRSPRQSHLDLLRSVHLERVSKIHAGCTNVDAYLDRPKGW